MDSGLRPRTVRLKARLCWRKIAEEGRGSFGRRVPRVRRRWRWLRPLLASMQDVQQFMGQEFSRLSRVRVHGTVPCVRQSSAARCSSCRFAKVSAASLSRAFEAMRLGFAEDEVFPHFQLIAVQFGLLALAYLGPAQSPLERCSASDKQSMS